MTDTNDPSRPPRPSRFRRRTAPRPMLGGAAPRRCPCAYATTVLPVGKIRARSASTTWYWWYKTHEEMKGNCGQGIGGALALLLAVF